MAPCSLGIARIQMFENNRCNQSCTPNFHWIMVDGQRNRHDGSWLCWTKSQVAGSSPTHNARTTSRFIRRKIVTCQERHRLLLSSPAMMLLWHRGTLFDGFSRGPSHTLLHGEPIIRECNVWSICEKGPPPYPLVPPLVEAPAPCCSMLLITADCPSTIR